MADTADTIPQAQTDYLNNYGAQVLGVGVELLKRATNTTGVTDPDTKANREKAQWPWKTVAMIVGGVAVLALVLRYALKK